jgi:hypothetical protein
MKLTYRQGSDGKGAFLFECEKNERDTPKAAGFWFHGSRGDCRKKNDKWGCGACNAGIEWSWWIPDYPAGRINAAKLIDFADDAAKAALSDHVEAVEGSFAADAEIDTPAPAGLNYLPYQRAGIKYAAARENVLFGDEMGLGKTIQALGLINAKPDIKSVLVIGPASLRINWAREAEKWLCRPFNIHVHDKTQEPVPEDANFIVVSFALCRDTEGQGRKKAIAKLDKKAAKAADKGDQETVDALMEEVEDLLDTKWAAESLMERKFDLVIIDEVHYLKNPKAQQTKAIFGFWDKKTKAAVEGLADRAGRKCYLTGTPIQNRPIELHPMLASLAPREFGNFMKFAKRYAGAHQKQVSFGRYPKFVWDFGGATNLEELSQRLRATVMVRRLKKDVLTELPPKRRQIIELPPNGAARAIAAEAKAFASYEEKLSELQQAIDLAAEAGDENAYLDAVNQLSMEMEIAFEEISRERHALALKKIPVVVEHTRMMLESGIDKLVIFCSHHDVVDGVSATLRGTDGETSGSHGRGVRPVDSPPPRTEQGSRNNVELPLHLRKDQGCIGQLTEGKTFDPVSELSVNNSRHGSKPSVSSLDERQDACEAAEPGVHTSSGARSDSQGLPSSGGRSERKGRSVRPTQPVDRQNRSDEGVHPGERVGHQLAGERDQAQRHASGTRTTHKLSSGQTQTYRVVTIDGRDSGDARQDAVDAFQNDPETRVIVGTIGAMGVGLTLTAASTVIFAELDWVPANLSQAEDRCHRIGQDNSVLVQHLVFDGSLDAKMAHFVAAKQAIIDRGLDTKIPKQEALPRIGGGNGRPAGPAKFPTYTDGVREAALEAMRTIDSYCDGVHEKDGMGFSMVTRSLGHSLAGREELSDAQTFYALKIARVHHRQLGSALIERLKLAKAIEAAFRAASSDNQEAA